MHSETAEVVLYWKKSSEMSLMGLSFATVGLSIQRITHDYSGVGHISFERKRISPVKTQRLSYFTKSFKKYTTD